MGAEASLERKVCSDALGLFGVLSTKLSTPGNTGYPDRIFWLPGGKPLLIEFKSPGMKPDPKQEYIHNVLRALGYTVEVHDDYDEAMNLILTNKRKTTND